MYPNRPSKEFIMMQQFIEDKCGISLSFDKEYLIESRLSQMLAESGLPDFEQLYLKICNSNDPEVIDRVIDAITTNETFWFRDKTPWRILENILLPGYVQDIRAGKRSRVRIWSTACSSGQEPYSIAMSIDRYLAQREIGDVSLSDFEILATDISHSVLQIASDGKYDSISIMRGLEDDFKGKYFKNTGRIWTLEQKIKEAVDFRHFNLRNDYAPFGRFDIVFCRNVLIYFSERLKKEIMDKISAALNPQGILFIGNSELFTEYNFNFTMEQFENGVYYKLKR